LSQPAQSCTRPSIAISTRSAGALASSRGVHVLTCGSTHIVVAVLQMTGARVRLLNSTKRKMVKRRLRGARVSWLADIPFRSREWTAWSLTSSEGNADRSVGCQKLHRRVIDQEVGFTSPNGSRWQNWLTFIPGSYFFALSRFSNLEPRQQVSGAHTARRAKAVSTRPTNAHAPVPC